MSLDELIQKIPKPMLVGGILIIGIAFFVYNDPLKDECAIQASIFTKKTEGLLTAAKIKKKTQFAQIKYWRNRCKEGNSVGSCDDYFEGLRVVTKELRQVNDKCQIKYSTENTDLAVHISEALQIMPLVAWGEKPPSGTSERAGWLTESNLTTFCYLKKTFILLQGEEVFLQHREKIYQEYPGEWPDQFTFESLQPIATGSTNDKSKEVDMSQLVAENRPRAFKTTLNPAGKLSKDEIYERSLFSIRCDLYM